MNQKTVAADSAGAEAAQDDDDSSLRTQVSDTVTKTGDGNSSPKDMALQEARNASVEELDGLTAAKWKFVYQYVHELKKRGAFTNLATLCLMHKLFNEAFISNKHMPYVDMALASKSPLNPVYPNPGYVKYLEMSPLPAATAAPPAATVQANETRSTPISAAAGKNGPTPTSSPGTAGKTDCEAQKQKKLLIDKTRTILREHTLPGAREAHIQDLYDYAPTLLKCNMLSLTKERMRNIIRHQWAEHTAEEQRFKSRVAADDWAGRQKHREGMGVSLKRPASPGNCADRPMKQQCRGPKA
ncbi:hypothetical protein CkaCkLH20_06227 [Colletotrichum karsti]|uniref:Uncharacterized protein n=1 Tax=Colletotrichum karsti TaxID=1095194 RepID=A0A9P6LHH5_9PEZI|nr:uncharacterized protein CkaCkLH20_06227 [Colletotrichum karsti]KAF9876284.1 hypothetical protein CkaCkLH20_06227 [Colletotrichum karsti]